MKSKLTIWKIHLRKISKNIAQKDKPIENETEKKKKQRLHIEGTTAIAGVQKVRTKMGIGRFLVPK